MIDFFCKYKKYITDKLSIIKKEICIRNIHNNRHNSLKSTILTKDFSLTFVQIMS